MTCDNLAKSVKGKNKKLNDKCFLIRYGCFTWYFISSNLLLLVIYSSSCGRISPLTSPLQSPSSSPYASPISSETNSRAGSPWNSISGPYFERNTSSSVSDASVIEKVLPKEQIQEQWDTARKIEEVGIFPNNALFYFLFVEFYIFWVESFKRHNHANF